MRAKLGYRMIVLINCIIIGLFGFGLFSKNILKDDQLWIGSICEGISFQIQNIYTIIIFEQEGKTMDKNNEINHNSRYTLRKWKEYLDSIEKIQ